VLNSGHNVDLCREEFFHFWVVNFTLWNELDSVDFFVCSMLGFEDLAEGSFSNFAE
jgi:hypothetical protein